MRGTFQPFVKSAMVLLAQECFELLGKLGGLLNWSTVLAEKSKEFQIFSWQ